jgi:hypothetical protein
MSEKKRILTQQERDQAQREEAMRAFRAAGKREETVKQSPEPGLSGARENEHYSNGCQGHDPHDVDARGGNQSDARAPSGDEGKAGAPFDAAKITVREGERSAAVEARLSSWEETARADAQANGGVVPPKVTGLGRHAAARLKHVETDVPPPSDTESLLNGLIAECRFLMHEVAFNSARLTYDPEDRIRFLGSAESMARAAATVGDTIGRLRAHGAPPVATHRHELVYMHVQSPSPGGEATESENQ